MRSQNEKANGGNEFENGSYGPWMQVSYGRNYRINNGTRYGYQSFADGKRTGNKGYWGKSGVGGSNKGETPIVGEVKAGQDTGNKKDSTKGTTESSFKKAVAATSNVNLAPKKIEGSRFAVLSDNLDEEPSVRKGQAPDCKVLTEISNQSVPNRRQLCTSASKYFVDSPMDTNISKFPKENITEKWVKKSRKSIKKMSHQPVTVHQSGIEEDVDDSEVLQSLHNKILETEMIGSQVSMAVKYNQIEVSDAANFDNVASKLKEAMETRGDQDAVPEGGASGGEDNEVVDGILVAPASRKEMMKMLCGFSAQ
ncbi:hypothetical protein LWI29_036976 [Acer saccharum]|uniref:Uncharacterized protein n=1 Tax=Acer saccharum TaxID=4024 RepID=A0AA39S3G0_ACESA|nr:hypothetical protein LWI29_036976 [Acer saccharum]